MLDQWWGRACVTSAGAGGGLRSIPCSAHRPPTSPPAPGGEEQGNHKGRKTKASPSPTRVFCPNKQRSSCRDDKWAWMTFLFSLESNLQFWQDKEKLSFPPWHNLKYMLKVIFIIMLCIQILHEDICTFEMLL